MRYWAAVVVPASHGAQGMTLEHAVKLALWPHKIDGDGDGRTDYWSIVVGWRGRAVLSVRDFEAWMTLGLMEPTYALVLPDGQWRSNSARDDQAAWASRFLAALCSHTEPDDLVVSVECHAPFFADA